MGDGGNGYIKLHRKLLDCPVFDNEKLLKVWIWCLFKATYKDRQVVIGNTVLNIKQGQFVYGRDEASKSLKIPHTSFSRYMSTLQNLDMLTLKSTNKWTLATIKNWDVYQNGQDFVQNVGNKRASNGQENSLGFQQVTDDGFQNLDAKWATNGQQMGTNKKDNNIYKTKSAKEKPERKIIPPTLEMVSAYCESRNNNINPEYFCDYYESRDWFIGKNKMKDWQAAIRTWEGRNKERNISQAVQPEVKKYDV